MSRLTVANCLSQQFMKVGSNDTPNQSSTDTVYAVFDNLVEPGVFLGLVTCVDVAFHLDWIFSELVKNRRQYSISANTTARRALSIMNKEKIDILSVLDDEQQLIGIVTPISLLTMIYQQEQMQLDSHQNKAKQIKAKKQLEAEIRRAHVHIDYLKGHDFLTGFSNLSSVRETIQQLINLHPHESIAILLLGIDNFRIINDTMGSQVGDSLLRKISKRIGSCFRKHDIFARKGGDEFIIVFRVYSTRDIVQKAESLLEILAQSYLLGGQRINLTASLGISLYPDDGQNADDLLTYADIALTQAKEVGKNNYQFFTQKLGHKTRHSQRLQKDLSRVLDHNELSICYQPQVETNSKRIIGVEALLRWQHPRLGLISPTEFIPLAEKSGHIIPIGNWVLLNACKQSFQWQQLVKPIQISVNVSASQFHSHQVKYGRQFILNIQNALEEANLPPERLELEITESIIMKDDVITKNNIKKMKEIGVKIACDDFGIGYSSFKRLKQLPLDTIKIDKSLIKDIPKKAMDVTIIRAIIAVAHQLNIKVIAEGVENKEQFTILADLGCDMVQGNYFSKPILPEEILDLLQHLPQ